jgi:hypothetical protein
MVDSRGLGVIGFILAATTIMVMLVAVAVVQAHVGGRLALEGAGQQVAALPLSAEMRR